ncbi:MAG: hypothetical protein GF353_01360, partial [Candidatus Lokiarchaeota archaeon]|nr:hypothetical protein [Candidatus Lokiarchaeota archaeon]
MVERNNSLPKGWISIKLGQLVSFEYGKGLVKKDRVEKGNYPVYGSNGIVGYHNEHYVSESCLIVGRKGAVGAVHLSKKPSWPIDTTYYVIPSQNLNLFFLYYLLKNVRLDNLDKSTAIPGLNRNDAYVQNVKIPPLPEQNRIVTKIEELFSQLDAGIAELKKAQEGLKIYRQSVLKYAFEGKLTEGWRKENADKLEPAHELIKRIKAEREKQYQIAYEQARKEGKKKPAKPKEMSPIDESELAELPKGWEWTYIMNIGEVVTGTTPSKKEAKYYSKKYPFFKPTDLNSGSNVRESVDYLSEAGIKQARLLPENSTLITCIGATIGKTGIIRIKGASNQQINAIIPNVEIIPDFIYYLC